MIGGAILSPNPTANSVSVAEEEDEACVTRILKSPQGCYLLASGGFFVLLYFRYVDYVKIPVIISPCKEILDA